MRWEILQIVGNIAHLHPENVEIDPLIGADEPIAAEAPVVLGQWAVDRKLPVKKKGRDM